MAQKTNARTEKGSKSSTKQKSGQPEFEVVLLPGPRKKAQAPPVRLSHHKARSVWFQARSAWPVREAPVRTLVRERTRVEKALATPSSITSDWESVGPTNIGGRITCLACHPTHPERIWVGAAGGGVWQSNDGGQTWQSFWKAEDILNIGSITVDPARPDTIYCGTGEANLSLDSYPGVGLYK